MQKKSKTILTAVVTVLFVLSIGYFALLAPTTAWYYQNEDKSLSFTFGNFGMNAPQPQSGEQTIADIVLRGTTRFADKGEVLFDEMTHVIKVTAENAASSVMSGSVGVRVKQGGTELDVDNTEGLRWFVYEPKETAATVGSAAANTLKIANSYNESLTLSLHLTADEAATVSNNGASLSLVAGDNEVSITVAAGGVYTISGLPGNIPFELELPAGNDAYIVGAGKKTESFVPAAGKNIEIRHSAKLAIDKMLKAANSAWPIDYKTGDFSTYTGSTLEAKYEAYNAKATAALKESNARGISVPPGSTDNNKKVIYIVFWAEYGSLKDEFQVASAPADRAMTTKVYRGPAVAGSNPVTYSKLSIEVYAAPDIGGTQTQTLTITSDAGLASAAAVKLYTWNAGDWTTYTGAYNNGSDQTAGSSGLITVPASGGSATVSGLPVGARFKLEAVGSTNKFSSDDATMDVSTDGSSITGTLANVGSTVCVGTQPRMIQITSQAAATNVKLYTWSSGSWAVVAGTYQTLSNGTWSTAENVPGTGVVSVPAGSAVRVLSTSFTANARYKLEITDASPTAQFNGSSNATQIIGKISGVSNEVTLVPQMRTLQIFSQAASGTTVVKLYTRASDADAWAEYTGQCQVSSSGNETWSAASDVFGGVLSVPAGGAVRVRFASFSATESYKLEITGASPTVHFGVTNDPTQVDGTISSINGEFQIVPNA